MNLCNFAQVIISRCTKDASTINWRNANACSSDDLKLDIPAHSQLFTTQTRHTLYHTFMRKYPKMQISFEKFKYKLPRIQKYITNSKYWKHSNTNGEQMEFYAYYMKVETSHYSYIMTASLIGRSVILVKMSVEIFNYIFLSATSCV
jgi:hypothetical protein